MANAVLTGGGINYGDILSSPYGPKGEIAPELALQQQSLNRRQQLAHLLLQQAGKVAPGQMVGRFYVGPDWKEGLTSLGSGIAGLGATIANQREEENIAKEAQRTREDDIQEFLRSQKDVPAVPPSNLDPGTFGARAQTVSAPAPREAVAQAMTEQGGPQAAPPAAPVDPILPGAAPPGFSGNYPVGEMPDESGWAPKGPIGDLNAEAPPTPPMQVAQAMVPQVQGPVSEGTIGRERTPEERQAALIRLMASRDPQAAAIGRFMSQQEATKAEKEEARAQQKELHRETMQNQLTIATSKIDQMMSMGLITQAVGAQMKGELIDANERMAKAHDKTTLEAARIAAGSREKVAETKAAANGTKALPGSIGQKFMENSQNLRMAERAQGLIEGKTVEGVTGDPNATGMKGYLPDVITQRFDPTGVETRAAVANLGSMIIHDRSGAAVTASEYPRLRPFIPSATDDPATVKKKLSQFVTEYKKINEEMTDFYSEAGYSVPKDWHQAPEVDAPAVPPPPGMRQPTPHAPYDDPQEEAEYQEYLKQEKAKFLKEHSPPTR